MVVGAVDDRYFGLRLAQALRRPQAAEATADDDYAG
jgi:hypothetical protein